MLYILLSGMPPFYGDNEQQIFDAVLRNKVDFEADPWPKVSAPAKVGLNLPKSGKNSIQIQYREIFHCPQ